MRIFGALIIRVTLFSQLATEFILDLLQLRLPGLGHKRIAFITGPLDLHSARTRRQAFIDGIRAHGVKADPKLIREGTHTAEGGQQAMEALLRLGTPPTAVVCSNDWTAIGALHAIDLAGLRVPAEISVVGFDDIPLARYTSPPLTSVRMSAGDVGSTAFEALFRLAEQLGAETRRVAGTDFVEEILKLARREHVAHFLVDVVGLRVRAFEHVDVASGQADGLAARGAQRLAVDAMPVRELQHRGRQRRDDGETRRRVAMGSKDGIEHGSGLER